MSGFSRDKVADTTNLNCGSSRSYNLIPRLLAVGSFIDDLTQRYDKEMKGEVTSIDLSDSMYKSMGFLPNIIAEVTFIIFLKKEKRNATA